jgi:hypothetical protein
MAEPDWLASQFERLRPYLATVADNMLGSVSEAEDAVQQTWPVMCCGPRRGSWRTPARPSSTGRPGCGSAPATS